MRCIELEPPQELLGLVAWYSDISGVFQGDLGQREGADAAALVIQQMQEQAMKMTLPENEPVTMVCFGENLEHTMADSGFLGYLFTLFQLDNLSGEDGVTDSAALLEAQPDYLLATSEEQLQELTEHPVLGELEAVKEQRAFVIDLDPILLFLPQMTQQTQAFLEMKPLD